MNATILTCSSLTPFVRAAQAHENTHWDVMEVNRDLHSEPATMKKELARLIESLPPEIDTVIVAMGFCGGA